MAGLLAWWRDFWAARKPSERRALMAMAVVVGLAALAQLVWTAEQSRQRLRQQLPAFSAQVEAMRQNLAEWRRLESGGQASVALSDERRKEAERRLAALGGGVSGAWLGPTQWRLSGTVAFDAWVAWLGEMQQDFRLAVDQAQVTPVGPGLARIEADLRGELAGETAGR